MTDLRKQFPNMSPDTAALNAELLTPPKRKQAKGTPIPKNEQTDLEARFAQILDVTGFKGLYDKEYQISANRRWRADFALLDHPIAFEVEGGVYTGGRHVRPLGFIEDCDKYNAATFLGWQVYRFTVAHIDDGRAFDLLERLHRRLYK